MDRATRILASVLLPGLGHALAGSWRRGLMWLVPNCLALPIVRWSVIVSVLLAILLRAAAAVDSARLPRPAAGEGGTLPALLFLGGAGLAVLLTRSWMQPLRFRTSSMVPTIQPGEHLLVDRLTYRFRDPERGELVAFRYPNDPSKPFVKRVLAIGGDTVAVQGGIVSVNGRPLVQDPVDGPCAYDDYDEVSARWEPRRNCRAFREEGWRIVAAQEPAADFPSYHVPPGTYFMVGDNRSSSHDSRSWGPVPRALLLGKVLRVIWSAGPDGPRWDRLGQTLR